MVMMPAKTFRDLPTWPLSRPRRKHGTQVPGLVGSVLGSTEYERRSRTQHNVPFPLFLSYSTAMTTHWRTWMDSAVLRSAVPLFRMYTSSNVAVSSVHILTTAGHLLYSAVWNLLFLCTTSACSFGSLDRRLVRLDLVLASHPHESSPGLPRSLQFTHRRLPEQPDLCKIALQQALNRQDRLDQQGIGVLHVDVHEPRRLSAT